jgi:pyruvate,water dikinase
MSYYGWPQDVILDKEADLEVIKCFLLGGRLAMPVRKPLPHWSLCADVQLGWDWACEQLMVPTTKGTTTRSFEGLYYHGLKPTTQEEEKQREPIYRERMKPWIEDFEGVWRGKFVPEFREYIERLKKIDIDLEKSSDIELLKHLEYSLSAHHRIIQMKFHVMYAAFTGYAQFVQMCRELTGIDEDHPQFKKLLAGFPTIAYEADRGACRLGNRAVELGLESLFKTVQDNEELLVALEQSEAGRKWLGELREFLNEHGWRLDQFSDYTLPNWVEKPALALPHIRGNMAKGGMFAIDEEHKRFVKEREEAERDILSRVPKDKRDWFRKLMIVAQWAGIFSEEHDYYYEQVPALCRPIFLEIGKRAVKARTFDDRDDVFFLIPDEIRRLLINMQTSAYRKIVRIRREEYQRFVDGAPKMAAENFLIGNPDWFYQNVGREPIFWVFGGPPKVKPELKADLYGFASAPGVAEGIARVLMATEQLPELKTGEILVVPDTSPVWNPAFNFIKAVVTNTGGSLSHAVIVAREYGLPCVAGTQEATAKIKTGDRIKVDGDNCVVYILKRAA